MTLQQLREIVNVLIELTEVDNLTKLPEIKAMKKILQERSNIDKEVVGKFCVAAALNNYQEFISKDPERDSYWGRFVNWTIKNGQDIPPWKRFPQVKQKRFLRFKNSGLWSERLLEMGSKNLLFALAMVMGQNHTDKTICFAPLVLSRWASVINHPFEIYNNHPLPVDSRIDRLLKQFPTLLRDLPDVLNQVNEKRHNLGKRPLSVSDFDSWAWQLNL